MAKDKSIGLTDKQEKFCQEYLIDLNGTQAAIRAGYSEKTANEQATRLLANVSIIHRLSELRKPLAEKVGITQEMVLNELAKVGFANLKDYLSDDLDVKNLSNIEDNKSGAIASLKRM
jgi:phage terminase small subunit